MTSNPHTDWEPRVALVVALAATLGAVTIPNGRWIELAFYSCAVAVGAVLFRIPLLRLARRVLHALPFLLLIAITVPLSVPGRVLFEMPIGLTLTHEGAHLAGSILIKATLAIVILGGLTLRVPPERMLAGLRGLKCPSSLVMILGSLLRFFPLIGAEWRRMRRAARVRGPRASHLTREGRVLSQMVAALMVRSLDRSERVHCAMMVRGFDGVAVASEWRRLLVRDWLVIAMGLIAVVCFRLGGMILG